MSTGDSENLSSEVPFDSYTPRVAVVTGAAQGIGLGIAQRLAEDGFDVAVNDISAKHEQISKVVEELRKKGRRAIAIPGDVTSEADVASMVDKSVKELGSVDVMVANAGIVTSTPITETSVETFDRIYGINVRGVFLCLKLAALQMIKQGRGGRLITASSLAGKQGLPGTSAYSSSKFAIRGLTQSAAHDLKKYGITVNGYAPGYIKTPMLFGAAGSESDLKAAFGNVPMAEPESIASIVSYLAKRESYFITGQTISVNGGLYFD